MQISIHQMYFQILVQFKYHFHSRYFEVTKYTYYETFKLQDRLDNKSLQIYFIQLDIWPNLETL